MRQLSLDSPTAPLCYWFNSFRIRAVQRGDKMWFVAQDVASILGSSTRCVLRALTDSDISHHAFSRDAVKGKPVISESGLVRAAIALETPGSAAFSTWLLHDFLPGVRGKVSGGKAEATANLAQQVAILRLHLSSLQRRVTALEDRTARPPPTGQPSGNVVPIRGTQGHGDQR
ncbi:hypothetical protein LBW59_11805 [Ralstonia solanacearum]|uniref:Bro-N domain-containing protein n=1 Tax=Ralstonia solanacearum TaxID=305 RepID=A0AAW5ZP28_RALSL|nr:BRO family protein [Ralstonia solanacearum]MDB0571454.1 hypothetical protein [Ralstonia solanacearum]